MINILSPVTKSHKTSKICSFHAKKIIQLYEEIGLDVSRFFQMDDVYLMKCQKTGYRFYYPFISIGDASFYEDLSKNRSSYYSSRWEHYIAMEFLEIEDKVLEIGSGYGKFLKILKVQGVKELKGIEINPDAVRYCQEENLNVETQRIENESIDLTERYNAICSFQVLEHIWDINSFINSAINLLEPKGKIIFGVPNNNPFLFMHDKFHTLNLPPHHAGLWNKKSLKNLEKVFPLKLISLKFEPLEKTYSAFLGVQLVNNPYSLIRLLLSVFNKIAPSLLKQFICYFFNGRNIVAVFEKTEHNN